MADFTSDLWSLYITGLTLAAILACAVLLWVLRTRTRPVPGSTVQTTGHQWDETLVELDHPLPRWWLGLFVITLLFGLGYLLLFPGLGNWPGLLHWSSAGQHREEIARAEQQYGPLFRAFAATPIEQLATDPRARQIGESLFLNHCAQCHGSDGRGARGFPNLADADWLYGGEPAQIEATIADGRHGVMPALGAALGGDEGVRDLVEHVLSLSGSKHDAGRAVRGHEKFGLCAACHGPEGKGNTALGAPNLTDATWLHGGSREAITETLTKGRDNRMPAHRELLGTDKVHLLAAWVYGLSHR